MTYAKVMAASRSMAALPAAGNHRERNLPPRELLARSGAASLHATGVEGMAHSRRCQSLTNLNGHDQQRPWAPVHEHGATGEHVASRVSMIRQEMAEMPPAGVPARAQVARTRSEFKEMALHGQFSNESRQRTASAKHFSSVRGMTAVYLPHQPASIALRREADRARREASIFSTS
mmetsp:Transcript_109247/g.250690  ORF Transcript_109247/g.250690 Transcript_109247/m.250690 type:complete len:176 (-) Transcript_109247:351-878(-)